MSAASLPFEIKPRDLKMRLESGEPTALIDVREPFERQIAHLEGSELIPMNYVPHALPSLEAKADETLLVIYCHHGVRSLNVVNWLRNQGLDACQSLQGGIDAWSLEIDPAVPRY